MQRGKETVKAMQTFKLISDQDTTNILGQFSIPDLPIPRI